MALLAGAYRLSKRQIQQAAFDLFGLSISAGMIAKLEQQSAAALEAPCHELALSDHQAPVVHIDETSWLGRLRKAWLRVKAAPLATVFTIAKNRSGEVARALLGSQDGQVVASDRYGAYEWILASRRQTCWAHLRRDFQAMIDRGGAGEPIGRRLLESSNRLFHDWRQVRDGPLPWDEFQERMSGLRREVKRVLKRGTRSSCAKTAAT